MIVASPIRAETSLNAQVPDLKFQAFIVHCLNIEANSGHGSDNLAQMQLVKNGGLARVVKSNDNGLMSSLLNVLWILKSGMK